MSTKRVLSKNIKRRKTDSLGKDLMILGEIKPSPRAIKKYLSILRNSLSLQQRELLESIPELRSNGHKPK